MRTTLVESMMPAETCRHVPSISTVHYQFSRRQQTVEETMADVAVRPLRPDEREAWDPLWQGYLTFYEASLPSTVTEMT
jgi:hypothetical protein